MQWWIELYSSLPLTCKGYSQCYTMWFLKLLTQSWKERCKVTYSDTQRMVSLPSSTAILTSFFTCSTVSRAPLKIRQEKNILNFLPEKISFIIATKQLHFLLNRTRWPNWLLQVRLSRKEINVHSHMQEASYSWQSLQLQIDNVQHSVTCSEFSKC